MEELLNGLVAAGLISQREADALRRQLDPLALREWAEATLFAGTLAALQNQQRRFLRLFRGTDSAPTNAALRSFWDNENELLFDDISGTLRVISEESAASYAWRTAFGDEATRLQQGVVEWMNRYYIDADQLGSIPQLNRTGRTQVARSIERWRRGELPPRNGSPLGGLIEDLAGIFGPERAERIAPTEVTRIFTEAGRQAEESNPNVIGAILLTAFDEVVCEICGPLHEQRRLKGDRTYEHPELGALEGPPFHVRCRCDETPVTLASALQPPPREDTFVFEGVSN